MIQVLSYVAYLDSFVAGWVIVDYLANLLLQQGESFTKIRFFGSSFLEWRTAVEAAYLQVVIAMVASFFIGDWTLAQILATPYAIIPITLVVLAAFHLYVLGGLPYNITWKRAMPSGILVLVAWLINANPAFAQSIYSWLQSIG